MGCIYLKGNRKKVPVTAFIEVVNLWATDAINDSEAARRLAKVCTNGKCDRGTFRKWAILFKENGYDLDKCDFLVDENGGRELGKCEVNRSCS